MVARRELELLEADPFHALSLLRPAPRPAPARRRPARSRPGRGWRRRPRRRSRGRASSAAPRGGARSPGRAARSARRRAAAPAAPRAPARRRREPARPPTAARRAGRARSARPTEASTSLRRRPSSPRIAWPSSTFSRALRNGTRPALLRHERDLAPAQLGARRRGRARSRPCRRRAPRPRPGRSRPASRWSSVVLPEPDGPVTTVTRAPAELGVEAGEDAGCGGAVAVRLDDPAQRGDGRLRPAPARAAPAPARAARRPPAALTTMRPSSSEAAAREPIPARSRNSCGSRSQPPRPTTIVSPRPAHRLLADAAVADVDEAVGDRGRGGVVADDHDGAALGGARARRARRRRASRSPRRARRSARRRAAAAADARARRTARPAAARRPRAARDASRASRPRPTRSQQLLGARRPLAALGAQAQPDQLARGQLGRERALVVLVEVADDLGAVARAAAAADRAAGSSPKTRIVPAEGRSSPARMRRNDVLPAPLGPSTVRISPSADAQRQPLQRGRVALGRRVDAEQVLGLDGDRSRRLPVAGRDAAAERAPGRGADERDGRERRRRAPRARAAASRARAAAAARARSRSPSARRSGRRAARARARWRRRRPRRPARRASARRRSCRRRLAGADALRLEVEQLGAPRRAARETAPSTSPSSASTIAVSAAVSSIATAARAIGSARSECSSRERDETASAVNGGLRRRASTAARRDGSRVEPELGREAACRASRC